MRKERLKDEDVWRRWKSRVDAFVLARGDYPDIAAYSKALADFLSERQIDLVVLAGFLTIFDEQMFERFPYRILNIHPALIPEEVTAAEVDGIAGQRRAAEAQMPSEQWASCRHVNGVSIFEEKVGPEGFGGAFMVASTVRATPADTLKVGSKLRSQAPLGLCPP